MGKGQGTESRFHRRPQENDVTSRAQKDRGCTESTLGEVAKGTKEGLRDMGFDVQPCRHQLKRPPDSFTDITGVSVLIFECILCGCQFSLTLDSKGEVDREYIIPPQRKSA